MSIDLVSALIGAAIPLTLAGIGIAVSWGKLNQLVATLFNTVQHMAEAVEKLTDSHASVRTTVEQHDERLDRLEAPLFRKQNH
jgi:hypothetical protein